MTVFGIPTSNELRPRCRLAETDRIVVETIRWYVVIIFANLLSRATTYSRANSFFFLSLPLFFSVYESRSLV